jgi:hypothetical protein
MPINLLPVDEQRYPKRMLRPGYASQRAVRDRAATGKAVVGAGFASNTLGAADAATGDNLSIENAFTDFMRGIGGTPSDAGGALTFISSDPIVRSHFRLGACMAIPAMAGAVGAAAIWRERTGQSQDLEVDLRGSACNILPYVGALYVARSSN